MQQTDVLVDLILEFSKLIRKKMSENISKDRFNWLQIHALCVVDTPRGVTMKEMAKLLMVTAPTATVFVNRLVKRGLVKRRHDPANRREVRIVLTDAGKRLFRKKMSEKRLLMKNMAARLSPEDIATLARILKKLINSVPSVSA